MTQKIFGFKTTLVLLIITTIAIILATFIESATSTEYAKQLVYNALWFEIVLGLLGLNITGSLFLHHSFSWKKITVPLFHLSFVLIIIGAFFTRYTGSEGMVYIREGQHSNIVKLADNSGDIKLPFSIYLDDFELLRYPGSNSPSSYSSFVTVDDFEREQAFEYHIYMNHVLIYRGWRFFQTSYDQDELGTVLTASRDTIGTPVTYAGYFLTIISLLISLLMPGTYFRKQLVKLSAVSAVIAMLLIPEIALSKEKTNFEKTVDTQQSKLFGELVVQDVKGRMKTMNTFSGEFMHKLYGSLKFDDLSSDQVVLSILTYPEYWAQVPLIKVRDQEIRTLLQLSDKYLSYAQLFDSDGQYKLGENINRVFRTPEELRSKTDKNLIKLDDQANILFSFLVGNAIVIFPIEGGENNKWYAFDKADVYSTNKQDSLFLKHVFPLYIESLRNGKLNGDYSEAEKYLAAIKTYQSKVGSEVTLRPNNIQAELIFNRLNLFERLEKIFALIGFVMLILFFVYILRGRYFPRKLFKVFYFSAVVLLLLTEFGVGLRWYIGGYIPISNSFEVMIFLSGIVLFAGLVVSKKQPVALALALILGYTFLFVASMNNGNPEIGNLVPVLKSYWLSIHVAVITSSYALFALAMMIALVSLLLYLFASVKSFSGIVKKTEQLGALVQVLLIVALYMLTIGTILGGIWANESWGRYWGWDPKETWALISILIYAFVAHMRFIPALKDEFWNNLATFWAFSSILMTFFGVNYFLVGLHSYAGVGESSVPVWIAYTFGGFVVLSMVSGIRYFHLKTKTALIKA